ncbi:hypothetical protein JY651_07950 [Pyxidicoccus parkwayensis]|uniref:Uncharacterized protein n=1 Tax=Pyxidicoccus parkwayensis TaxID=2813578 RepID=A0ABX7P326_9BACT|nr:hypothetical protein [Pyxidicoccus parkwaysis]QSQ24862.1 hypothetical protein JY651_07950 [Pyxidicoccus parkwaysis]
MNLATFGPHMALQSTAQRIEKLDPDHVEGASRTDGYHTFKGIRSQIVGSLSLIRLLGNIYFQHIPDERLMEVARLADALAADLLDAESFHRMQSKDEQRLNGLSAGINSKYLALFDKAAPIIATSNIQGINASELERHLKQAIADTETYRIKAEQLFNQQASFSIEQAVTKQAGHFSSEAAAHEKFAGRWLVASAVSASLVLAIAGYAAINPPEALVGNSPALTVLAFAPRFVVLSIAFYALSVCARNYRTSRHNFIVNRHRTIALNTFTVFTTTANDSRVKDAILAQAASTIFSPQPSGYSIDQAEPLPQATAVELIQRLAVK